MNTVDLEDLKAKAMAADQGPHHIYTHPRDSNKHAENLAFHAACHPQIIVELIDRLQRVEKALAAARVQNDLAVWYGSMPESNGKTNWTAILYRKNPGIIMGWPFTIGRSEYPDRVRYQADIVRYLIGELEEPPFILDYDSDKHSGYKEPTPVPAQPSRELLTIQLDRTLGGAGTAYDMPGPRRAYTHKHQPSKNSIPYRLGYAARSAINYPHGDNIDLGLYLLRALHEKGFGVFEIERLDIEEQGVQP